MKMRKKKGSEAKGKGEGRWQERQEESSVGRREDHANALAIAGTNKTRNTEGDTWRHGKQTKTE